MEKEPKEEPKQFVIENASVTELEAMCYQQIKVLQMTQNNINLIEAELARRQKPK